MRRWLTITALALLASCSGPKHPEVPADCQSVCAHVGAPTEEAPEALDCELGQPTEGGGTCLDVCANADDNGFPWPVQCMLASSSCEQVEACE